MLAENNIMEEKTLFYIIGGLLGIVAFFFRALISQVQARVTALETQGNRHENKIGVMEVKHDNLSGKLDEINLNLKEFAKDFHKFTENNSK